MGVQAWSKSAFDRTAALTGLVVWAPVLCALALLVLLSMGSPILFRQQRAGLHGRIFTLYKFRTMRACSGPEGELLPDSQRLTRLGRFLRSTSLDELPELFNVLKGDMSLVGPRPLLAEYLPLYSADQARRHEVRPGITGLAQISGRNKLGWEKRFALDIYYVEHQSWGLDLRILLRTFVCVVRQEGVDQSRYVTATRFAGSSVAPGFGSCGVSVEDGTHAASVCSRGDKT
ncbi:MAG: sugar transferase [Actinomycetia bacterium]|nr:sugar transferase [Actinomycetes bacterium]